jgi:hypothetical protein
MKYSFNKIKILINFLLKKGEVNNLSYHQSPRNKSNIFIRSRKSFILLPALTCIISSCAKTIPEEQQRPIQNVKPQASQEQSLVIYKSDNINGYQNKPIIVDNLFIPILRRVDYYARRYNVTLKITSSFRTSQQQAILAGAVVKPASMSNHLAGHAIDMNIVYKGKWYDSRLMQKRNLSNLPNNVKAFINAIRQDQYMRWGGDFSNEDPVHIDDHLNKNKSIWLQRYNICQAAYAKYNS